MSNSSRAARSLSATAEIPRGEVIGRYRTYAEAQKAVDHLSDEQFDVSQVSIIGSDLKSVEQVTGRLSYPKVALQGALNGIMFGAFFGLLMSMVGGGGGNLLSAMLLPVLMGGAFWMLMATITYAMSRGKRDFTSTQRIVAASYEVIAAPEVAGQARQVLGGMAVRPGQQRGPQQYHPQQPGSGRGGPQGGAPGAHGPQQQGPGAPGGYLPPQAGPYGSQHGAGHGGQEQPPRPSAPQGEPQYGVRTEPGPQPHDTEPSKSARFQDLPDGRPQYGIRTEPEPGRPAPRQQPGAPVQPERRAENAPDAAAPPHETTPPQQEVPGDGHDDHGSRAGTSGARGPGRGGSSPAPWHQDPGPRGQDADAQRGRGQGRGGRDD